MANPILQIVGIIGAAAFTYFFNRLWRRKTPREKAPWGRLTVALVIGGLCGLIWFIVYSQAKIAVISNFESTIYLDGDHKGTATDKEEVVLRTSIGTHCIRADYAGSDRPEFYRPSMKEINIISLRDLGKALLGEGFRVRVELKRGEGIITPLVLCNDRDALREAKITIEGVVEGENIKEESARPRVFPVKAGRYVVTAEFRGKSTEPERVVVLDREDQLVHLPLD